MGKVRVHPMVSDGNPPSRSRMKRESIMKGEPMPTFGSGGEPSTMVAAARTAVLRAALKYHGQGKEHQGEWSPSDHRGAYVRVSEIDAYVRAALDAADAPAMLELLRTAREDVTWMMRYFMARQSRECPSCESDGGTHEDDDGNEVQNEHGASCTFRKRAAALDALLDKHGRGP